MFKPWCVAGVLLMVQTAMAQTETRLALQALNCSAVFTIFAHVHVQDTPQAARMNKAAAMFADVYRQELQPAIVDDASLQAKRRAILEDIKATRETRSAQFHESGVICGAWAEGFLEQGDWYKHVPVYPKVVAMHTRQHYQALAEDALKRWAP